MKISVSEARAGSKSMLFQGYFRASPQPVPGIHDAWGQRKKDLTDRKVPGTWYQDLMVKNTRVLHVASTRTVYNHLAYRRSSYILT